MSRHKVIEHTFKDILETIEYIKKQNCKNISADVFECAFDFVIDDWGVSIYKCYNPFFDYVLKFHNGDKVLIFKPCGNIDKRDKGCDTSCVWNIPKSVIEFGMEILSAITQNNIVLPENI